MLKPKKKTNHKLTRQELKEDKLVKTAMQAKNFIDENYKQVMTVVTAVLAFVAIIIFYTWYNNLQNEDAGALLGIAQIEYNNSNYDKALSRLQRLVDEYGGTEKADQGTFLMANIYYQKGKTAEAMTYFEEFISEYDSSPILVSSAYAGIGSCLERDGKYEQAAEKYLEAADKAPDFPESDEFKYLAGINFKKAGNVEKAREIFEDLVETHLTDNRLSDAESQLVLLGAKG